MKEMRIFSEAAEFFKRNPSVDGQIREFAGFNLGRIELVSAGPAIPNCLEVVDPKPAQKEAMEELPLLNSEERKSLPTSKAFMEELKKVTRIAAPMVVVTISQFLLRVVPMIMVGHLGELYLSSTAIATSLTNVTGFSVLFGMASALETLCGQAYGAEQYQKLGAFTFGAILSLILVCLPVSVLWIFMDKLLVFLGQDPAISVEAGKYAIWLIPSLFPYAILESLVPYLQTQCVILPMLLCSTVTLSLHVPLCWFLVFKFQLGTKGAALAISLSYWVNVILLGTYLKYSPACENTRPSFSKDVFLSIGEFFRFALPSAGMICLEWWSFELLILLSGLLPNPELESSVLSICLTTTSVHYLIPYSIGAAASTRVSNELGAGNSRAARLSVCTVMVLAVAEAIVVSATLFCCRSILGYAYSDVGEVVDYVKEMTPIICLSITMDSLQAVLSGVARGSGWQHMGAYVNFGAFYLVGIPLAIVLGFIEQLRGKGIWIGIATGSMVQVILLSLVTSFTNWQKQANEARERVFKGTLPANDESIQ
ncbi:protein DETOXIFICATION 14-like isoform X2 [Diospyros lotus]|uniref:protein DETOXIFICATION 14-like isoform X2 n=1 Tax=Diospyros lotus TaxID=55363 RepID=UPI0022575354|nr:protein DETOXIFICATION 14-like isoform X2 [Diospyros lotus]